MRVIIDKISKVKPFEPFNVIISIESWEDLHQLTDAINSLEVEPTKKFVDVFNDIWKAVIAEKVRQQQGVDKLSSRVSTVPNPIRLSEEELECLKIKPPKDFFKNYDGTDEEIE